MRLGELQENKFSLNSENIEIPIQIIHKRGGHWDSAAGRRTGRGLVDRGVGV
jgi:hypothetical protein